MNDRGDIDKSLFSIVNISVQKPISENTFAAIIRSGLFKMKYCAQIFAFFTELPLAVILTFIKRHKLKFSMINKYYNKNIKKYYQNQQLEEYFKYAE
ncbi:hypothetical protein COT42_06650 [Candidatus Saganbacteria bacterium CG08_land_8_20_14_0_20_45_16]|uniref:Uncharacterized protein n=1 Tax=Candidatus Saganbacteria bacterium CG08_land_8_20_14_0_20_45_16 TaxID=2014293 RepID=A0A2H0XVC7_UNCSA|nr:MAG: hypothetical protein COT42_06650 [Candidatus Saganbacteria bacterium CG08_land_8_20_14_0_20_45_16]